MATTIQWQDNDLELARKVFRQLSERAKTMFNVLMDKPGKTNKLRGEQLALAVSGVMVNEVDAAHHIAGVQGWPGRYCLRVGRELPIMWEKAPVGSTSGSYWMDESVAALFRRARVYVR